MLVRAFASPHTQHGSRCVFLMVLMGSKFPGSLLFFCAIRLSGSFSYSFLRMFFKMLVFVCVFGQVF